MFPKMIVPVLLGCIVFVGIGIDGFPSQADLMLLSSNGASDPCNTNEMELNHSGTDVNDRTGDNKAKHLLNRAICYMHQEKWDSAQINLEEVLSLEPGNIIAIMNHGFILLRSKASSKALKDFHLARRLADEQNVSVEVKLQILEWLMEAHRALNKEVPFGAPEGEIMRLENLEDDAQWRTIANSCVDDDDGTKTSTRDSTTLARIANRHYYEFQFDEALKCYNETIKLQDNVAAHYRNRALCLMQKEDCSSALDDIEKALTLEPDNVRALFYGTLANIRENNYGFALDDLDRALELADRTNVSFEEQRQLLLLVDSIYQTTGEFTVYKSKIMIILSRALLRDGFYHQAIDLLKEGLQEAEENHASSDEKREMESLLTSTQRILSASLKNEPQKTTDSDTNTSLENGAVLSANESSEKVLKEAQV